MAVSTKFGNSKDRSNGRGVQVHYHVVTKSNIKGSTALVKGEPTSSFVGFFLNTRYSNGNGLTIPVSPGKVDVLFRTGSNDRWQALSKAEFKKRFPGIKL